MDVYTPGSVDYAWPKEFKPKHGDVPEFWAEEAKTYIRTACRCYPFQMRYYFGEAMWMRFCEAWANTGDVTWALRQI